MRGQEQVCAGGGEGRTTGEECAGIDCYHHMCVSGPVGPSTPGGPDTFP